MRIIVQRVKEARVWVGGKQIAEIGPGLMVLIGVHREDTEEDAQWLATKLVGLRIFGDENGLMNRSVKDIQGEILIVSQFTLSAAYKKGNRPSFIEAARPELAIPLYEHFVNSVRRLSSLPVKTGEFGGDMDVELTNQGPVTLLLDTRNKE